jgi:hypothetical protein
MPKFEARQPNRKVEPEAQCLVLVTSRNVTSCLKPPLSNNPSPEVVCLIAVNIDASSDFGDLEAG